MPGAGSELQRCLEPSLSQPLVLTVAESCPAGRARRAHFSRSLPPPSHPAFLPFLTPTEMILQTSRFLFYFSCFLVFVVCAYGPMSEHMQTYVCTHGHTWRRKVNLNDLSAFRFVVIKHRDQNQLGGERVCLPLPSMSQSDT